MILQIKKPMALMCIFLLQSILMPGSSAFARRRKSLRAYSFIVEGGKASQGVCDGETTVPRRLKHMHDLRKFNSYLGSELLESENKDKPENEMWKHYFRSKASCNVALEKTPSAIETKTLQTIKKDLPSDDSADDDEPNSTDTTGAPDAP